ncbi:MAG: hypothetical protein LC774_09235 [Acidobacteria bacterium]|nr:hypothetical protein [Acidobacteriota bacterium]
MSVEERRRRIWVVLPTYNEAENVAGVARAVAAFSRVLPADFVLGVLWQIHHNAEGHPASLLGTRARTRC